VRRPHPYGLNQEARNRPVPKTVRWLLEHNASQSKEFTDTQAKSARLRYRHKHPTLIGALKCMDGRCHLANFTGTPLGIIQPFRNIGGKFDIGWPYLQSVLYEFLSFAKRKEKDCILFTTYHFSKGDVHRGCKGFNYDTAAARAAAYLLRDRIALITKNSTVRVVPILVGLETDEDALIIHGSLGESINLANEVDTERSVLTMKIGTLLPVLGEFMLDDLMQLVHGNIRHIRNVRASGRTITEVDHCECVIGIGRGFDWLHTPNKALLIGAYSFDVGDPIVKAAGIVLDNLKQGRIHKKDGVVLMASALYWDNDGLGIEKALAIEKAMALAEYALTSIKEEPKVAELLPHLSILVGDVYMHTRQFSDRTEQFWKNRGSSLAECFKR
jgi:hypothetical protein